MVRGLSEADLNKEWQALPKNWYAIYQWKRTSKGGYTERIAQWIIESFTQIALATDGLRNRSFRADDHHGQITLSTGIEQLTEKRIVRAMFNAGEIPLLGKVIDYEVPLKDTADAKHGDIDLLCSAAQHVFCIEAKHPKANESILKAVIQAYAYTLLAALKKPYIFIQLWPHIELSVDTSHSNICERQIWATAEAIGKAPQLADSDSAFEQQTRRE